MVRPLARQAWQSDADRIDSLERWSITAPLQADHRAELAELRAKTEAPIHGVAAPDVDEDFKTEPLAKRTDTPIMAPPTDNRQQLEPALTEACRHGALVSRNFLDADSLTEYSVLAVGDLISLNFDGNGNGDVSTDATECLDQESARVHAATLASVIDVLDALTSYANPAEAHRDLLDMVPPTRLVKQQSGDLIAEIRTRFGVSHEDVQRVSGLEADVLRRVESDELPVSMPAAAAVLRAVIEAAEEPASAQLRRPVDACAAPEFDGIV